MLIAIPAFNEQATIRDIICRVRKALPEFDLLVVNDGSTDATAEILRQLQVSTATHLCNLGYSRTIQTVLKYAQRHQYDAVTTLDADGQHHPEQIRAMIDAFQGSNLDMMIGSRYMTTRDYSDQPLGRRIGMQLFSLLVGVLGHQRIYDTSSGMKVFRATVFDPLVNWYFADFHAEAILYLMRLGYKVGEYPITVSPRRYGQSMHSVWSHVHYPPKMVLLVLLAVIQATMNRRKRGLT